MKKDVKVKRSGKRREERYRSKFRKGEGKRKMTLKERRKNAKIGRQMREGDIEKVTEKVEKKIKTDK